MLLRSISPLGCGIKSISSPQVHVHHCTIFGFQATRNPPRCTDDGRQTNQQRFQHQTVYCLLCGTATHTRTSGFFPRQQYYASLTTTHAVTRAFNFEKQKSTRAVFLSTDACTVPKVHPSDCLSPHPLSLRRTDRISELQKKAEGGDNRLYCLGIGNIAQSHSSEIFHDTSMCLSQVVGGPNSLLAEYHPTHSICLCMCASTARARAQGGEGDTGWLHLVG